VTLMNNRLFTLILLSFVGIVTSVYLTLNVGLLSIPIVLTLFLFLLAITNYRKASVFVGLALISSIMLIPKIKYAGINLRFDDYVSLFIAFLLIVILFIIRYEERTITSAKGIITLIIFYLTYCSLFTAIQLLLNNLNPLFLLYLVKEIQYFLYFFFVLIICTKYSADENLIKWFTYLSIATVAWGIYQFIFTSRGYYGIGMISEPASSQSGGAFFTISLFFLYLYELKRKYLYGLFFLLSVWLTFATVSRAAMVALVFVLILYILRLIFVNRRKILTIYLMSCFAVSSFFFFPWIKSNSLYQKFYERINTIDEGSNFRMYIWQSRLSTYDLFDLIFGRGKGYTQTFSKGFTLAADSQYVRLLLEIGIIGLVLWLVVIFSILFFAVKHYRTSKPESMFIILFTLGYLVMSITHEVFMVAIQGSLYWIMISLMLSKIIVVQNRLKKAS